MFNSEKSNLTNATRRLSVLYSHTKRSDYYIETGEKELEAQSFESAHPQFALISKWFKDKPIDELGDNLESELDYSDQPEKEIEKEFDAKNSRGESGVANNLLFDVKNSSLSNSSISSSVSLKKKLEELNAGVELISKPEEKLKSKSPCEKLLKLPTFFSPCYPPLPLGFKIDKDKLIKELEEEIDDLEKIFNFSVLESEKNKKENQQASTTVETKNDEIAPAKKKCSL